MKKLAVVSVIVLFVIAVLAQTVGPGYVVYVTSAPSGNCSAGAQAQFTIGAGTVYTCQSGTWTLVAGGGGAAFSALTGGTNSSAAMVVGSGASLATSGTGTIAATSLTGTPALPNGTTATTQTANDNSTKVATTAYVDAKTVNTPTGVPVAASPSIPYNGLVAWWSADCISLSDASTCATPSNGSTVTLWYDRSGNSLNLVNNTGTCTFNTAQINSKPAVNFSSCGLTFSSSNYAYAFRGAVTVFAVIHGTNSGASGTIIAGPLNPKSFQYRYNGAGAKEQAFVNTGVASLGTGTAASDTSYHQINVKCDITTNPSFRIDRATDTTISGASCSAVSGGAQSSVGYRVDAGNEFFPGDLAELLYYSRVLSSAEITTVETYLNSKYGL